MEVVWGLQVPPSSRNMPKTSYWRFHWTGRSGRWTEWVTNLKVFLIFMIYSLVSNECSHDLVASAVAEIIGSTSPSIKEGGNPPWKRQGSRWVHERIIMCLVTIPIQADCLPALSLSKTNENSHSPMRVEHEAGTWNKRIVIKSYRLKSYRGACYSLDK
jgi:hypothetical protein